MLLITVKVPNAADRVAYLTGNGHTFPKASSC